MKDNALIKQIEDNFVFDFIYWFDNNGLAQVQCDNWCGYINQSGKVVKKIMCDDFTDYGDFYIAQFKDKKALVSPNNYVVASMLYDEIRYSYDNLFIVKQNRKYGIIDDYNEVVIDFIYDEITYIYDLYLFIVSKDNKYGIMDIIEAFFVPLEYEYIKAVSNNQFIAAINGKEGIIDYKNQVIIPFDYYSLCFLSDRTIIAEQNKNEFVIINLQNEKVCKTKFKEINNIGFGKHEKLYPARVNELYGFIDEFGKLKIDYKYKNVTSFVNSELAAVTFYDCDDKWGFIDENDNLVLPFEYLTPDTPNLANQDFIIAKKGTKSGVVDRNGQIKIDFIFDRIFAYDNDNYICAQFNGKWGFIDRNGKPLAIDKESLNGKPISLDFSILPTIEQVKLSFGGILIDEL